MKINTRRVVVTGVSAVTPIGVGWKAFWENSLLGMSGCAAINGFPINYGFTKVAGSVADFKPKSKFNIGDLDSPSDRLLSFAEYAVKEALEESGLLHKGVVKKAHEKTSLFLSSAIGQMGAMESAYIKEVIHNRIPPEYETDSFSFHDITEKLVDRFELKGCHNIVPTGCVGGCDALAYGVQAIRSGRENRVIVGAAEAPITPLVVAAFGRIGANSTRECPPEEASRPFDINRDGFVIGEGAGILVLEDEHTALERGALILAEIKGTGSVNNCFHMTDIHPSGADIARSCMAALEDAQIQPSDIDFINAHGSSTPQNDVAETAAYKSVFGERYKSIPVTSLKSQIGHALSAANAMEMVSSVLSIMYQMVPPTINLTSQDPNCDLDVVTTARRVNIHTMLKASSGFSGIHSAIVLSKYGDKKNV